MLQLKYFETVGKEMFDFQYFAAFENLIEQITGLNPLAQGDQPDKRRYVISQEQQNFAAIREALHLDFAEKELLKQMTRLNKDPRDQGEDGIQYVQHKQRIKEIKDMNNDLCFFILILLQRIMWRQQPRDANGRVFTDPNKIDYTYIPISIAIQMVKNAVQDIMKLHTTILEIKYSGKAATDIINYEDNLEQLAEKAEFGDLIKIKPEKQLAEVTQAVKKKGGRKKKVLAEIKQAK